MRQKLLGRRTGLRVSELALGSGLLGVAGTVGDPDEAKRTLAAFADGGGTFIDTSSAHQGGRGEQLVGAFLAEAGRDRFVLSTKYGRPPAGLPGSLASGSHRGSMLVQVEDSLRRLGTDRIDVYAVEFPDGVTPADEILRGMETLVRQGKVVAVALSNFSAWQVAHAAALADCRGWAPVAAIHYQYNLVERTAEAEHLPMAEALGMAVLAWSPQARGVLAKTPLSNLPDALVRVLSAVAVEQDASPGAVSLAWLLAKGVFPVVGARNVGQLQSSLASTRLVLSAEQVERLDASVPCASYPKHLMAQMRSLLGVTPTMLEEAARGASTTPAS